MYKFHPFDLQIKGLSLKSKYYQNILFLRFAGLQSLLKDCVFKFQKNLYIIAFLLSSFLLLQNLSILANPYEKEELQKLRDFSVEFFQNEGSQEWKQIDAILEKANSQEEFSQAYTLLEALVLASVPQAIQKQKLLSAQSLTLAEESFAESLSAEYWNLAKDSQAEAEVLAAGLMERILEVSAEKDISKRTELFRSLESDLRLFLEKQTLCLDYSKNALSLSLSQSNALLDSQSDILETIQFFKKIREPEKLDSVELHVLEKEIENSMELIRSGNIRKGFYELDSIRRKLDEIVLEDFKAYALNRIETGKSKLQEASSYLEKEKKRFSDDPETLLQLEDNLQAARESIELAEKLIKIEKYIESISKAEDSLFLTERFKEDLELADLPDTKLYEDGTDTEPNPTPSNHTVKRGETLVRISTLYYGSYRRWKEIFKLNRKGIKIPSRIFPGQVLKLPKK